VSSCSKVVIPNDALRDPAEKLKLKLEFGCFGQNITDGIFLIFRLIYSELNNIGTN